MEWFMLASELMNPNPVCCKYYDNAQAAATLMLQHQVGFVVVVDEFDRLAGVVSDRDLCLRVIAGGRDSLLTRVQEVMTRETVCCATGDSERHVLELMQKHCIRRLIVSDDHSHVKGVISIHDLIRHSAATPPELCLALGAIMARKPSLSNRLPRPDSLDLRPYPRRIEE
jgi:CBS domain-containing protein